MLQGYIDYDMCEDKKIRLRNITGNIGVESASLGNDGFVNPELRASQSIISDHVAYAYIL
jgi:hypothetical protein